MSEQTSSLKFENVGVNVAELFVAVYITLEDGTVVQTLVSRSTGKVEVSG